MMSVRGLQLHLDIFTGRGSWDQYSRIRDPWSASAYPVDQLRIEQSDIGGDSVSPHNGSDTKRVVLNFNNFLLKCQLI